MEGFTHLPASEMVSYQEKFKACGDGLRAVAIVAETPIVALGCDKKNKQTNHGIEQGHAWETARRSQKHVEVALKHGLNSGLH